MTYTDKAEEILVAIEKAGLFEYDGNSKQMGIAWDTSRGIIATELQTQAYGSSHQAATERERERCAEIANKKALENRRNKGYWIAHQIENEIRGEG